MGGGVGGWCRGSGMWRCERWNVSWAVFTTARLFIISEDIGFWLGDKLAKKLNTHLVCPSQLHMNRCHHSCRCTNTHTHTQSPTRNLWALSDLCGELKACFSAVTLTDNLDGLAMMKPLIQSSSDHFIHSKACRDCFPAFWLFTSSVFSQAGSDTGPLAWDQSTSG